MNRTLHIINDFLDTQTQIMNIYKNASRIDGQYNPKIRTIANILAIQELSKLEWYKTILNEASDKDPEICEQGYLAISSLLKKRRESITSKTFSEGYIAIEYALSLSKNLSHILYLANTRIISHEIERPHLQNTINIMTKREDRYQVALLRFLNTTPKE